MQKSVTVSAPGKLMLLGEHAVMDGKPCLVTAVAQRMRATLTLTDDAVFRLDAPEVGIKGYEKTMSALGSGEMPKGVRFAEEAVKQFFADSNYAGGVRIVTSADFVSTFGFGSSSASTVCVIGGLSHLFQAAVDLRSVFDLSYKVVLAVQGKGSGFDIAAATYGGTLRFVIGGKEIEAVSSELLPLVIGYTGVKADTVTLIDRVRALRKKNPELVDGAYRDIGALIAPAEKAIRSGNLHELGGLMNINQSLLSSLGVSSDILDALIHASLDAGALGAKLSGAGGGDCMIALAEPAKRTQVAAAIIAAGGQVIDIPCGAQGLSVDSLSL